MNPIPVVTSYASFAWYVNQCSAKTIHPTKSKMNWRRNRRLVTGKPIFTWQITMSARAFTVNPNPITLHTVISARINGTVSEFAIVLFITMSWFCTTGQQFTRNTYLFTHLSCPPIQIDWLWLSVNHWSHEYFWWTGNSGLVKNHWTLMPLNLFWWTNMSPIRMPESTANLSKVVFTSMVFHCHQHESS